MAANNKTKSKRSDRAAKRGEVDPEVDRGGISFQFPPNGYNAVEGHRQTKEWLSRLAERLEKTAAEIEKEKASHAKTKKLLVDTLSEVQECLPSHNVDAAKQIEWYDSGERHAVATQLRASALYLRDWTTEGIVRQLPWTNPAGKRDAIRIARWIDAKAEKAMEAKAVKVGAGQTANEKAKRATDAAASANLRAGFTFNPGQALFDGKDLGLPAGLPVEVLQELHAKLGESIPHRELHRLSTTSEASGELRHAITEIRRALESVKAPFRVENKRGYAYHLASVLSDAHSTHTSRR